MNSEEEMIAEQKSQTEELFVPFPAKYVKNDAGKFGSYVPHHIVQQRLLDVLGVTNQKVVEIIYDRQLNVITGVVLELSGKIDGKDFIVQEVGDCEVPKNWHTDGARLKDAMSDAVKRCAMRMGLGLHLWAQDDYFLHSKNS